MADSWNLSFRTVDNKPKTQTPKWSTVVTICSTTTAEGVKELLRLASGKINLLYKGTNTSISTSAPLVVLEDMIASLKQGSQPSAQLSPDPIKRTAELYTVFGSQEATGRAAPAAGGSPDGRKRGRVQAIGKASTAGLNAHKQLTTTSAELMRKVARL